MESLTTDVIKYVLTPILIVKDLYFLSLTNKYHYDLLNSLVKNKIISNIDNRLKYILGEHYKQVMNLIKQHKCFISSSLII